MRTRSSIAGFSAVETIAVVLVVAVLAVGGWWVWQSNHKSDKTNKNDTGASQSADKTKASDPSEGGKYLVIKEWGVRFLVPEDLRGHAYYAADTHRSDTMIVDSNEFPTGAQCASFAIGRTMKSVSNSTDPEGFDSSSFKHINDYYFSRLTGVLACSTQDSAIEQRASAVQKELYDATTTLESIE